MIEALIVHSAEDTDKAREAAASLGLQQKYALLPVEALSRQLKFTPATLRIVVWTKAIPDHSSYKETIEPFLSGSTRLLVLQRDETPVPSLILERARIVSGALSPAAMQQSLSAMRAEIELRHTLEQEPFALGKQHGDAFGWLVAAGVFLIAAAVGAYQTQGYWMPLVNVGSAETSTVAVPGAVRSPVAETRSLQMPAKTPVDVRAALQQRNKPTTSTASAETPSAPAP